MLEKKTMDLWTIPSCAVIFYYQPVNVYMKKNILECQYWRIVHHRDGSLVQEAEGEPLPFSEDLRLFPSVFKDELPFLSLVKIICFQK